MGFSAITAHLDGKLVIVAQGQVVRVVYCLVQQDTAINFLSDSNWITRNLQTTEHGTFYTSSLTHLARIDNVQSTLTTQQQLTIRCQTDGTLVVRTVLQTISIIIGTNYKLITAILFLLGCYIRNTMIGHQPHCMTLIFYHTIHSRAIKTGTHINQIELILFGIPYRSTR